MKNMQVIDGAINTVYRIYQIEDDVFDAIFPGAEQDVEFLDDVVDRLSDEEMSSVSARMYKKRIRKQDAVGIHGTLFIDLDYRQKYYPNKSEKDVEDFA